MSELSAQWNGTTVGDAATYAAPYCSDEIARYTRGTTYLVDRTLQGPIYTLEAGYTGQLFVTATGATSVQLATGKANVNGRIYENDAAIDFNPGAVNGYYRVVLRSNAAAATQTIRATLLFDAVGLPALTQNPASTGIWDVPIANFQIAGGVITGAGVIDERDFVNAGVRKLWVPALIGYNDSLASTISLLGQGNPADPQIILPTGDDAHAYGRFAVPNIFISSMGVAAICSVAPATSGTIYAQQVAAIATCGEDYNNHLEATTATTYALTGATYRYNCIVHQALVNVAIDDFVRLDFNRQGHLGGDTYGNSVLFYGWEVTYFGYGWTI